ncbi:hypothetical protein [Streptomyces sp. NPDC088746]|uniref:hypothetical protein n=1 Tax=Streptomyces sp. NPDC088746 TaxID=3365885 RepID=UPI00381181C1
MAQVDKLLERLVKRVNEHGAFFDITIFVGGAMISGRLAPRTSWLDAHISMFTVSADTAFVDDFAQEGAAPNAEEYLHLSQAKKVYGDAALPTSGGAFRVPLTEVQGWMPGRA